MDEFDQKSNYLREHLPYELCMLCHTHKTLPTTFSQLDWNVLMEAYAVHARSLKEFLTNKSGSNNFQSSDFIKDFRVRVPPELTGAFQRLDTQVAHLAKKRPIDPKAKFTIDDVKATFQWLEPAIRLFVEKLAPTDRLIWRDDLANPANEDTLALPSNTRLTATSVLPSITSSTFGKSYGATLTPRRNKDGQ